MKAIYSLLSVMFVLTASFVQANEYPQTKGKYQTIRNDAVGYEIEVPKKWQNWMEDTDDSGAHTNLYVGLKGRKLCGMVLMVSNGEGGGGFDMEDMGFMSLLTGDNPELDVFDFDSVDRDDLMMMHLRAHLRNPDTQRYFELDIYQTMDAQGREFTIVFFAAPNFYDQNTAYFDHAMLSFHLL